MSFCRKKSQSKEAIDHQKHEFSKKRGGSLRPRGLIYLLLMEEPCNSCFEVALTSFPSEMSNRAAPPGNLRSAISFCRTSNIVNLIRYIYISHSPFNTGNASLFLCLHGCAVACPSCATKQTFVKCRIILEGTLALTFFLYYISPNVIRRCLRHFKCLKHQNK